MVSDHGKQMLATQDAALKGFNQSLEAFRDTEEVKQLEAEIQKRAQEANASIEEFLASEAGQELVAQQDKMMQNFNDLWDSEGSKALQAAMAESAGMGQEMLSDVLKGEFDATKSAEKLGKIVHGMGDAMSQIIDMGPEMDAEASLKQVEDFLKGVSDNMTKAAAIKTVVEARLTILKREVSRELARQAQDGFADIVGVWQKPADQLGMNPAGLMRGEGVAPSTEELVGISGPFFLKTLHTGNLAELYGGPVILIIMGVLLGLHIYWKDHYCSTSPWAIPIEVWFGVKIFMDCILWCVAYWIESEYRDWQAARDVAKVTTEKAAQQAAELQASTAIGTTDAENTFQKLANLQQMLLADSASGLIALEAYDQITGSCVYSTSKWITPLSFGWDAFGLFLAIEVYAHPTNCANSPLSIFLFVYGFWFVFTMLFRILDLVFWIVGMLLQSDAFSNSINDMCVEFDADNNLPFPICTVIFEKIVLRNRSATRAKALEKQKQLMSNRRSLLERELAAADRELKFLDEDLEDALKEEAVEEEKIAKKIAKSEERVKAEAEAAAEAEAEAEAAADHVNVKVEDANESTPLLGNSKPWGSH